MIELVGYLGSLGAALMWLPQTFRAVRHRRDAQVLHGISAPTYLTAIVFNALLLTYGLLQDAAPVALAGSINLACAAVITTVVLSARRST